jgi:hypothetical protein
MFHYFLSWVVGASLIVSLVVPQTKAQDEHTSQSATAQSSGNPSAPCITSAKSCIYTYRIMQVDVFATVFLSDINSA